LRHDWYTNPVCKILRETLITGDGEVIEGAAAEEVEVMGRVTYFINSAYADDIPV